PAPPPAPAAPSASAGSAAGRFGVIMSNTDPGVVQRVLGQLGMRWWFSFFDDTRTAPGTQRVLLISTADAAPLKSAAELQAMARQNPGAHWLIGNEPNTPGQDNVTPARYAERLRYYADALRGIDPAAKLVGPNVLNWNRTCTGCDGGFTPGKQWTEQLAASYQERYGSSPPFDVWGVHAYTISWDRLPMTDPGAMIEEVSAFRSFVDSRQGDRAKPVWVTEFGVIWGYDQVAWRDGKVSPAGDLRNDRVQEYLTQFVGWLKDNAERRNIERWFLFISHGAAEPYATDYAGISLMTTGGADAELTPLGQTYRRLAGAP
ncbi:MAG: glycosyl hydrolase, partial [Chloroflexi bacterium]|nr:glycosyl hydrolase [Chloroflexota bacterium]